jgi:hypothetical protein
MSPAVCVAFTAGAADLCLDHGSKASMYPGRCPQMYATTPTAMQSRVRVTGATASAGGTVGEARHLQRQRHQRPARGPSPVARLSRTCVVRLQELKTPRALP